MAVYYKKMIAFLCWTSYDQYCIVRTSDFYYTKSACRMQSNHNKHLVLYLYHLIKQFIYIVTVVIIHEHLDQK